jgi:ribosomal protein S18 acetylase RimI-like enzyme
LTLLPVSNPAPCRTFPPSALAGLGETVTRCFLADLDEDLGTTVAQELDRIAQNFDPARDFLLCYGPEGAPEGFLISVHDDRRGGETSVLFWAVDPPARGRGIGRELLCQACREAARLGQTSLRVRVLAASAAAPRVLWDCGFRVVELFGAPFAGRRREWVLFAQEIDPE